MVMNKMYYLYRATYHSIKITVVPRIKDLEEIDIIAKGKETVANTQKKDKKNC